MEVEYGQKHYTATVFVVSESRPRKILLVHHKKFDKWMPPGGHIEKMENPIEAAVREVKEESGVDIKPFLQKIDKIDDRAKILPLPTFILEETIDHHGEQPEHYHIDFVYTFEVPMQELSHQIDESYDIGWFAREDLENLPMFDNVIHEIDVILKKIGN